MVPERNVLIANTHEISGHCCLFFFFFFFAKKSCFRSREVSLPLTRCLIQRSLWAGCERMPHVSVCVESPTLRASSLRCPPFGSRLAFGVCGVGMGSEGMEERGTYYSSECFFALPFVFWNTLSFLAFRASCLFKDECKNRSSLYMKPSLLFSLPQEPWWYVCWDCHGHASWLGPALQNHEGSFLTLPVASVSLSVLALTFRKHLENHPKITGFWWSLDSRQWMPSFPDLEAKPPYCQLDGLSFYASYAIIWSTNGHLAEDGWGDPVSNWIIPGGPEVRTRCFHCQGPSSIPGWGTKTPQVTWHSTPTPCPSPPNPWDKTRETAFLVGKDLCLWVRWWMVDLEGPGRRCIT